MWFFFSQNGAFVSYCDIFISTIFTILSVGIPDEKAG